MTKKIVALILIITLIGCTSVTANDRVAAATFMDIQGHWSQADVELAVSKGYINGYEDGSFRPEGTVTRAEFVKMTVSALELTVSGETTGSNWYLPFVTAAADADIHAEADFSNGDWNIPMSRLEMARMAVRATGDDTDDELKWMYLATRAGLIKGTDLTGTLDVDGTTTRAQAVTIIERILSIQAGETLEAQLQAVSRAEVLWHKTNVFTVMPEFFGYDNEGHLGIVKWDPANLVLETPDGMWKGELYNLYAIDLEDPDDPYRHLLPPLEELFFAGGVIENYQSVLSPVTEAMNSYVLLGDSEVHYNHAPDRYTDGSAGFLAVLLRGVVRAGIDEREPGTVNGSSMLVHNNTTPINATIVNKDAVFEKHIILNIGTLGPKLEEHRIYEAWMGYHIGGEQQ